VLVERDGGGEVGYRVRLRGAGADAPAARDAGGTAGAADAAAE
jgi:hypothetical protein